MYKVLLMTFLFGCSSPSWIIEKGDCEIVVYTESISIITNKEYKKLEKEYEELKKGIQDCEEFVVKMKLRKEK